MCGAVSSTAAAAENGIDRYAPLHAPTYGEAVDAMTLVANMLEALMRKSSDVKECSSKEH